MSVTVPRPPRLQIEDGVIEEARRRTRVRRRRALVAALIGGAGLAALLAIALTGNPSAKAHLNLTAEGPPSVARTVVSERIRISLAPNLEPGRPGWCVVALASEPQEFGCRSLLTPRHPFIGAEDWDSPAGARVAKSVLLTPANIQHVLIDGRRVRTLAVDDVPFDLRVAVLRQRPYRPPAPARRGQTQLRTLAGFHPPLAHLPVLTVAGKTFTEAEGGRTELPVRYWHLPAGPSPGVCELHAPGLAGLSARWGGVLASLAGEGDLSVPALLPCVETGYIFEHRAIQAAVLLGAARPAEAPPVALPGFDPIPHLAGLFNSSLACCQGPFTARREGDAWMLAAGGGPGAEQARVRLLRILKTTVRPRYSAHP